MADTKNLAMLKQQIEQYQPQNANESMAQNLLLQQIDCFGENLLMRPSAILSSIFSGLPSSRAWAIMTAFSRSRTSAGTSSGFTYDGLAAAMWSAMSCPNLLNSSVRATKSVSQSSSRRTASFVLKCMYVNIFP